MKAPCHSYSGIKLHSFVTVDSLYTVHYFENFKDYAFESESHDFWELAYLDSGELLAEIEGFEKPLILKQEQCILIPPNIGHNFMANGTKYSLFIISFGSKSTALETLKAKCMYSSSYSQRYIIGQILYEARKSFKKPLSALSFSGIELKKNSGKYTFQIIKKLLELFLLELLSDCDGQNSYSTPYKDFNYYSPDVTKVICYLKNSVYNKIHLTEVATHINMSTSHIQKKFIKEVGKSIMLHFTELKIEEAKFLLRSTALSVTEIAEKLSYDSVFHFSSAFKKITGIPPSRYVKSLQKMIDGLN